MNIFAVFFIVRMKAQDIYSLLPRLLTFSSFVILLVAVANTYACKGLDRIEEKLPILNQPTNQVSLDKSAGACHLAFLSFICLTQAVQTINR